MCETSGSHNGEDIDVSLLGCNSVLTCMQIPTFQREIVAVRSSETLVCTWYYNAEY
jgi:hypothetical protein